MSYDPKSYDASLPGSFKGDVEWYQQKALQSGGPVLELGAGTGRIAIPIAESGIDITALELDPAMLDLLAEKASSRGQSVVERITCTVGDMRTFALDRTFRLVIIPFHTFLHNLTLDDQLQCLERVYAHLRPGGELAFNVNYPSLDYMAEHAGPLAGVWRWGGVFDLPDGGWLMNSRAVRYDTIARRARPMIRTDYFNADGDLVRTKMLRLDLALMFPADIEHLLQRSGFELLRVWGDFKGNPLQKDSPEQVVEARRRP